MPTRLSFHNIIRFLSKFVCSRTAMNRPVSACLRLKDPARGLLNRGRRFIDGKPARRFFRSLRAGNPARRFSNVLGLRFLFPEGQERARGQQGQNLSLIHI